MRMQLIIKDDLKLDLDTYCEDNGLKPSDVIRHLIRTEIYQERSLAKIDPDKLTRKERKAYNNVKNARIIK